MRNHLIISISIVLTGLGIFIPEDQLLMMAGQNGELFLPLSSGGDDPFGIKIALGSYIVTSAFCLVGLLVGKGERYMFPLYLVNGVFYVLVMGLVSLDSSIIVAAKHGNWLPVGQLGLWLLSLAAVVWVSFNKASNGDGFSVA